jgi:hypothetical protein
MALAHRWGELRQETKKLAAIAGPPPPLLLPKKNVKKVNFGERRLIRSHNFHLWRVAVF